MKKKLFTLLVLALCVLSFPAFAAAAENTLKVGLYYGSGALASANLQNEVGSGYTLGWFDESTRDFNAVGFINDEEKITVTVNCGYHVQIEDEFASFEEAKFVADQFRTGFVCYLNNAYRVRVNTFETAAEAETAAATYATYVWYDTQGGVHSFLGFATSPSATGVSVIITNTNKILFEFDCSGAKSLGILPADGVEGALTWFSGYKWYGGFEYRRSTGGNINVINVVDLEDYVKGVLPEEMEPSWNLEALKAQAVCARTYALTYLLTQTKHYKSYKFDVCNEVDCQVYKGVRKANDITNQAAEETRGIILTCEGKIATAYYYASNGGASESSENVWTSSLPYLVGKIDPFEETITIPGYSYTETYTFDQLTQIMQSKDKNIGTINGVYVSKTSPTGNAIEVTFTDTDGKTLVVKGEECKRIFYTTLFGKTKSIKSMHFTISGGENANNYFVNDTSTRIHTVSGAYTISGNGTIDEYTGGDTYVITSNGTEKLTQNTDLSDGAGITITGKGSGHNVGMSQYGAQAMARLGYNYEDILNFYYTGISLERIEDFIENA